MEFFNIKYIVMKKHLTYFLLIIIGFTSCKKAYEPILESPDVRLGNTIEGYTKQLTESEFGWIGHYMTGREDVRIFRFKFDNKNRVVISANYRPAAAESSYRFKALQSPTLVFDTYSTLHLLNDPTSSVLGGVSGEGFKADFEFAFVHASQDTIEMKGVLNDSKLFLVRAKAQKEMDDAFVLTDEIAKATDKFRTYFKRTTIGGTEFEINIDDRTKFVSLGRVVDGQIVTKSTRYFNIKDHMTFFNTLEFGDIKINGLKGVSFDPNSFVTNATDNNGNSIKIVESSKPLLYDVTKAAVFLAAGRPGGSWWEAKTGFTVDGMLDAYGVLSIPRFTDYDLYVTGTNKSLFVAFAGGNFAYNHNVTSAVNADGILVNTLSKTNGTTTNVAAKTTIDKTVTNFTLPTGFYVIKVPGGFDIVSALDARSWIKFD
jgi:hypothetical protein